MPLWSHAYDFLVPSGLDSKSASANVVAMPQNHDSYTIAHIAIAVPELKDVLGKVESVLNLKPSGHVEEIPTQKVRTEFVSIGGVRFEFLEPTTPDSPISRFLEKRGSGIHHIAIFVEDLRAKLKELKSKGVPLIDEIPKIGADGYEIAFLHPKAMGGILVELVQKSEV